MPNVFKNVQGLHPRFNAFSAHTYRNDFTAQLGVNIPVYVQHVVPNTRVKLSTSALVRLQALIAPVMDNVDLYVHFWKCPYRLIEGDRFTQFISGEITPEDYDGIFATPFEFAEYLVSSYGFAEASYKFEDLDRTQIYNLMVGNGSLLDFLGYDVSLFPEYYYDEVDDEWKLRNGNNSVQFNFRSLILYYYLHLSWYMNENVPYFTDFQQYVDDCIKSDINPVNLVELYTLTFVFFRSTFLPHGWEKDYFTSALPNVQFGDPVTMPLSGSAPVSLNYANSSNGGVSFIGTNNLLGDGLLLGFNGRVEPEETSLQILLNPGSPAQDQGVLSESVSESVLSKIQGNLVNSITGDPLTGSADLSEASAITVNEFRFANALQVFKERQMRFGRRRQEYYKGFFDVTPEDLRLQLPKYLGGGRIPINIADIEQTSASESGQPLGRLAGKATAVAGGFAGFSTFCSEESIIIGIAFAMPHITYANSVSKFLYKTNDIYDYFNPSFEHLGEQAIHKMEVYAGSNDPLGEFGYTPRYNEYRFHQNEMHGAFKDSLSFWTLGRIFDSQPALNADFIYMQPASFNRIFAVEDSSPMLASMLFRVRMVQPVSKYGTPMLLV